MDAWTCIFAPVLLSPLNTGVEKSVGGCFHPRDDTQEVFYVQAKVGNLVLSKAIGLYLDGAEVL